MSIRDIKPELIEKAAVALYGDGWHLSAVEERKHHREHAEAALKAVIDDLRAEGAAQALRDAVNADGFTVRDSLGYHLRAVATEDLLARADRIEARDA